MKFILFKNPKSNVLFFVVALFMILQMQSAFAATYYASPSGSGSTCSQSSQCSLSTGIGRLASGDTLMLAAGNYPASLNAGSIPSGSSWSGTTKIIGAGANGGTRFVTPSGAKGIYAFSTISYVEFSDLEFDGSNGGEDGLKFDANNIAHIKFTRIRTHHFAGQGIAINSPSSETISDIIFINPESHHNGYASDQCNNRPGYCHGMYVMPSNLVIDGANLHDNNGVGIQIYPGPANNVIMRNSLVYNNYNWGLFVADSISNGKIYNNIVYGNRNNYGLAYAGSNCQVRNNIVYNNDQSITTSCTQSNNLVTNPNFVNAAAGDFHLQSNSPAINAGANLGSDVPTDRDGITRPQGSAYDIGAYEYVGSGSSDTTPPVISSVAASSITSSSAIITWTTNENADTQVDYGTTTAYGSSTALNTAMVTLHSQALSGLQANTLYHYRAKSRDAAGMLAISNDFTFSTSASTTASCTHYASPSGGGNGLSQSSPFQISNFWGVASAGKTLCLLDGTYTGANSMITPSSGLSGTSGNPITIRALNDGKVWIDGQYQRRPVYFNGNDWWVLEGFNAYDGSTETIFINSASNNNVLRRIVAWDVTNGGAPGAGAGNEMFLIAGANNVVEDCGAFGTGRKVLSGVQSGNDVVFRRCWVRFQEHPQGQTASHPDTGVELGYNAVRQTFENIIGTWDESGAGAWDDPTAIFRFWGANDNTLTLNSKVFGSIGYVRPGYTASTNTIFQIDHASQLTLKDSIAFAQGTSKTPLYVDGNSNSLTIQNVYGVSNSASGYNIPKGSTLSAAIGAGNNVFTTVNLCYQYQNGVLTNVPLWPWPMDQRIKEAIAVSGYKSVTTGMASDTGYVTDAMEQLFGQSIPAQCRTGGSGTAAPTVSLLASPSSITSGSSSTLTWSSANANSCTASVGWTGAKTVSGTQTVTPTSTTIYTLSCTGTGGTSSQSTTVTVGQQSSACTHYASPSGGGNGLSQSSPFQISNFWSQASAGKTLCLLDGTYTGSSGMIDPPDGLAGASGNPITVRALNDGGATLDGQGSMTNLIALRTGNHWFVISGVNAHGSGGGGVVSIDGGASNNRIERVIAWDRSGGNGGVFAVGGAANNNVLEDIAAFGQARYLLGVTQGGSNTYVRRFWGQWEQPQSGMREPDTTIEAMYNGMNHRFENVIATWNGVVSAPNPYGLFNIIDHDTGHQISGSIFYVKSTDNYNGGALVQGGSCGTTIRNSVVYTEKSAQPFNLGGSTDPCSPVNYLQSTTEIGGSSSSVSGAWQVSNRVDVNTVAEAPNIWNGAGTQGARVCKQYVNSVLTNNPLWPWPMDARIRAALISSGRNPDAIFGGTGNSVTQLMEQKFGAIPSECRAGGSGTAAPTVTLTASPSSITSGSSSTLTWSSTNANSCTASVGWTGAKATSGSQTVTPSSTTTYTLTCTGTGGSSSQSVTVTVATADTTPPTRSNGAPSGTLAAGTTSTTLSLTTNEAATCRYSTTANTAYSSMTGTFTTTGGTSHSRSLTGLANGQSYNYYVRCTDAAGNANTNDLTVSFSVATQDTTPLVISSVASSSITSSSATISWTTNENADTQVDYGTTTSYGSSTTLNTALATSHSQSLSGLQANTLYHYRGKSRDAAGLIANSQDFTFTTLPSATTTSNGDVNGDNKVDMNDVLFITNDFGKTSGYDPRADVAAPFGVINLYDIMAVVANWGKDYGGLPGDTNQLTVSKSGTGTGTVTGQGINCGNDCTESYPSTTTITLTATASAGSQFVQWQSGACSHSQPTCSVSMYETGSVTAIFDLVGTDTTPPTRSNGQPSGTLATGTTSATLSLTTNEAATCRYSTNANTAYSSMTGTFTTTGGTSHSRSLTGLANGQTYNYYVRCIDAAGNANTNDFTVSFSVASAPTTGTGLLQKSNLVYQGSFKVPHATFGGSSFDWGATAMAYNPAKNSLFIVGHDWQQQVAEISIPTITNSNNLAQLSTATVLQDFTDPTEGGMYNIPCHGTIKVGGLMVYSSKLYETAYNYYDAEGCQTLSHFTSGTDMSAQGDVKGPFQVGNLGAGFVDGWMIPIPQAYQASLGAPAITGNCCLSIIGRTSLGPSAFAFNPADLGSKTPVPAAPLLYYPAAYPTLGDWNQQSPYFNGATHMYGAVFPEGARSVLFFGRHGTGPYCYGDGSVCGDPTSNSKGDHAYPYVSQVWAYDVNELIAVKNGQKNPWDIMPYAVWAITLPFEVAGNGEPGGVAYDPNTQRVFWIERFADGDWPVIHVYKII